MKTSLTILAAALLAATGAYGQTKAMGVEKPTQAPSLNPEGTVHGCYGSIGELAKNSTNQFNSQGLCIGFCRAIRKVVAATGAGSDCYCGDKYPPKSSLVADSKCNYPCTGFGEDACKSAIIRDAYDYKDRMDANK